MRRPRRTRSARRRTVWAGLVLAVLVWAGGPAAFAGGLGPLGPPSLADSGAAFAPRPVRGEPVRTVLTAPRPAVRSAVAAAPARPAARPRVVELAWLNRGGLAVHPRRTERADVAGLPPLPTLPLVAAAGPAVAPEAARPALTAARPADRRSVAAAAVAPALPAPASPASALERFLAESLPGAWAIPARRTAEADAGTAVR